MDDNNTNTNKFLNGVDDSNNNAIPNLISPTQFNNSNPTAMQQPQMNNTFLPNNGLNNEQFNNQSTNALPNINASDTNNLMQPNQQQYNANPANNFNAQAINPAMQPQQPVGNMYSMPQQNMNYTTPPTNNTGSTNDEELLKAFIGNNYEKITTKPFNFAGFFFTTMYMFYRKMFLYAIISFIISLIMINTINNDIVNIIYSLLVGFSINKIYLYYAKKKIEKIKFLNQQKDFNELKKICADKGGTSVGQIFLGFLSVMGITAVATAIMIAAGIGGTIVDMFNPNNRENTTNENKTNNSDTKDATLVENVTVNGSFCLNSECTISIEESGKSVDYAFAADNIDLFNKLSYYSDHIKINIYYTKKGSKKTIVDYKIYLKSNNEEIKNVKSEDELRDKIGLYSVGTHTESFTLNEIGSTGFGYKDDEAYAYIDYTLLDSKNNVYEMKYIISDGSSALNLTKGKKYDVTFEVVKDTIGYDFYIKSVK